MKRIESRRVGIVGMVGSVGFEKRRLMVPVPQPLRREEAARRLVLDEKKSGAGSLM